MMAVMRNWYKLFQRGFLQMFQQLPISAFPNGLNTLLFNVLPVAVVSPRPGLCVYLTLTHEKEGSFFYLYHYTMLTSMSGSVV